MILVKNGKFPFSLFFGKITIEICLMIMQLKIKPSKSVKNMDSK